MEIYISPILVLYKSTKRKCVSFGTVLSLSECWASTSGTKRSGGVQCFKRECRCYIKCGSVRCVQGHGCRHIAKEAGQRKASERFPARSGN